MRSGCFIYENVNVVEVGHQRKSFRITFKVVLCRIARLHLLCRLRRGSLPRAVFVLRTSPRQAGSLVNPFAAQLACRGELKMPFREGSAAMGFEIKEIKRQSRAVKVTHPPAERRQLHKRSDSGLSQSNAD